MFEQSYRYRFSDLADLRESKGTLLLAILAAQGLFGEARVRMDAGFAVDESIRVLIVDASTVIGKAVNAIFTSFLLREFGSHAFNVRRVAGLDEVSR